MRPYALSGIEKAGIRSTCGDGFSPSFGPYFVWEELPLMNKVHGPSAPLLPHCVKASQLLSRNSNNGSDPFVHPHFQLLPGVPASIPYILSVMPYTASYFGLSSTDLNYLRQQAVKFILGRHWIEARDLSVHPSIPWNLCPS